jgi:hypothetical protein
MCGKENFMWNLVRKSHFENLGTHGSSHRNRCGCVIGLILPRIETCDELNVGAVVVVSRGQEKCVICDPRCRKDVYQLRPAVTFQV